MTKIQICNQALRLLGEKRLTLAELTADTDETAQLLNDIYDAIQDEVLASHPWNFAIKRATLTVLGGTIITWTASGTANVWQAALTTEPARVEFDGTEGTKKTSIATCTAAYYWYWASNVLYVYSTSDPDTAYTKIEAIIPEFDWDNAFSLPSGCLRVIKMEDNAKFVREEDRLFTDESTAKIQYIAQITDTTKYTPAFITAFAARLAAEIAFPLTNSPTLPGEMYDLYKEKINMAKGIDAQEGTAQKEEDLSWEEARE